MIQLPCRLPTTLVHGMHTVALVASPCNPGASPPRSEFLTSIQHPTFNIHNFPANEGNRRGGKVRKKYQERISTLSQKNK